MPTANTRREFAKGAIDRAIRTTLSSLTGKPKRAFALMLINVQTRSELLRPGRQIGHIDAEFLATIVRGLYALFEHRRDWLRPVESWTPSGRTTIALFSSLAHHLLADFRVPPVLLSAWFLGTEWPARRRQMWFRHLGRGENLRTASLPIPLTRRMAHEFCLAPAQFPIDFAIRWAQVRGLGGSDALARAVASTHLGREFWEDDAFWISAFHFFINHPALDLEQIGPIVRYLQHQKFEPRQALIGAGPEAQVEVELDPPQPDLSLKGWSVASLLRRVEEWHDSRDAPAPPQPTLIRWAHSAIGEFAGRDDQGRVWTIRELLDSHELAAEGRAMDHCVATYTSYCARRASTIWSVATENGGGRERVATVEVDPASRVIVQAKAKSNEEPDASSLLILKQWAAQETLTGAE